MKRWGFFAAFAMLVLTYAHAESTHHQLRVGTLSLSPSEKWVLIGVASNPLTPTIDLDFQSLGFNGIGMDHLEPKFLLQVTSEGIQKVRSFELDSLSEGKLPPTLVHIPKAKRSEIKHAAGNSFAFIGKNLGFPIAPVTILSRLPRTHSETHYKHQAYYLMEIVNKALPPYNAFPELLSALSDSDTASLRWLFQLGEALLTRYHPTSNWLGLHVPQSNDGRFYGEWRQIQNGHRVKNSARLVQEANEQGLNVILMGEDFAYILDRVQPSKKLLPWYLVSFANQRGAVELADFVFPGKVASAIHSLSYRSLAGELGLSFIPFSNIFLNIINKGLQYEAAENNDTKYLKRLEAFSSVLALTETQFYDPTISEDVAFDQFHEALESYQVDFSFESMRKEEVLNKATSIFISEEEKASQIFWTPSLNEKKSIQLDYYHRISNYLSHRTRKIASRSPCGASQSQSKIFDAPRKPVILFLIDGLRPDRFVNAAKEGLLPNLKALFVDRGVQLESYTSRSLTLPSWATIFTGFECDYTGLRSNTPFSKLIKGMSENYLDPKDDLLSSRNRYKNRAFQRIEENQTGEKGKVWLPGYFNPSQTYTNYMPISFRPHLPIKTLLKDYFKNHSSYINEIRFLASALDVASAQETAHAIRNDRSKQKLRLIMNWYASVDEASHFNNRQLPSVYQELDQAIGTILSAAKSHPVLKNATVFLISDHGHTGGFGPYDENSTVYQMEIPPQGVVEGPFLANTDFNLANLFAGLHHDFENYGFKVGEVKAKHANFDLGLIEELQRPHFIYTKPIKDRHATILIDNAGNNLAQVYLFPNSPINSPINSKDQFDFNYYDLTHFRGDPDEEPTNLVHDLLNHQIPNLLITDKELLSRITQLTSSRPVRLLAMPIKGTLAKTTADKFGANSLTGPSDRDPILVVAKKKDADSFRIGMIFTRSGPQGNDLFRYAVLKNFSQSPSGTITAETSDCPEDDPLEYMPHFLLSSSSFAEWKTDREWINLLKEHPLPTAIFSLARTLTLDPRYTSSDSVTLSAQIKKSRIAETPDFVLVANRGFGFRGEHPMESDHGGLIREEVKNAFFISSLKDDHFSKHLQVETPVLSRDIMPTVLQYAGLGEYKNDSLPVTQGLGLKSWIEENYSLAGP